MRLTLNLTLATFSLLVGALSCSADSASTPPTQYLDSSDSLNLEDASDSPSVELTDPAEYGLYAIGYTQATVSDPVKEGRELPTHIWYPASSFDETALATYIVGKLGPFELEMPSPIAQDGVPAAEGPWPLIIFSHGYGGIPTQSIDLCERLASHGFVVVSASHTGNTSEDDFNGTMVERAEALADRPRDIRTLIDTFTDPNQAPDLLTGLIDSATIGVTGHSFGGYTALSAAAGHAESGMAPESRVGAIAPICPDSSPFADEELSAVTIPTLFIGATIDEDTPIDPNITRPFALMSDARRVRVDVVDATHNHFAAICAIGEAMIALGITPDTWEALGAGALLELYEPTCGEDAFPMEKAMTIQARYIIAFFKTHLLGQPEWESLLSSAYAEACEPDVIHFTDQEEPEGAAPACFSSGE